MQTLIVALIVLTAVAFIGRRVFSSVRAARKKDEGCSTCGCDASTSSKSDWAKT